MSRTRRKQKYLGCIDNPMTGRHDEISHYVEGKPFEQKYDFSRNGSEHLKNQCTLSEYNYPSDFNDIWYYKFCMKL